MASNQANDYWADVFATGVLPPDSPPTALSATDATALPAVRGTVQDLPSARLDVATAGQNVATIEVVSVATGEGLRSVGDESSRKRKRQGSDDPQKKKKASLRGPKPSSPSPQLILT